MTSYPFIAGRDVSRPRWFTLALIAPLAVLLLLATGGYAGAAQCPAEPYAISSGFGRTANLGELKRELINYGCFGEYKRDLAQEIGAARAYIESRAGEVTRPAIVLDIDETSLSNWPAMLANDFGFFLGGACRLGSHSGCGMLAWELSAAAPAIAPMVDLVRAARAKGVAVFFLTGRPGDAAQRAATVRNLRRVGYAGWTELIMRAPSEAKLTATAFKAPHRARIAARGYTIIANIGDQDSDLAGGYAERAYKLPNPFYFLP